MAADREDPGNNVTMTLTVTINDVNDYVPRFEQQRFTIPVPEEQPRDSVIFTVKAEDKDVGEFGTVFYHITSGNEGATFRLDGITGALTLARELDYEQQTGYDLVVKATDNDPEHPLSSYCLVHVAVQDKNEHKPVFPSHVLHGFVLENAPPETAVLQVRAVDGDGGKFGDVNYTLVTSSPGKDWEHFRLDANTGMLYSKKPFDYEDTNEFTMSVTARDTGGLSATGRIVIHVQSQDEFAPEFSKKSYTFKIPRDIPPGYMVGRLYADDADLGPDGALVFQAVEADTMKDWKVNASTGSVLSKRPLIGLSGRRSFHAVVSSGRLGSLRDRSHVTIEVDPLLAPVAGIQAAGAPPVSGMAPWALALLISLALLAIALAAAIFVIRLRGKYKRHKPPPSEHHYDNPASSDFYGPGPYSATSTLPAYSYATPPSSTIKSGTYSSL